ncbi:MAG: AMP-dependent synthetase and ligase [Acidobacteria bacterium]|nr:AMP-dependent synthetase and ligase [Acidobacteriota bacterium]
MAMTLLGAGAAETTTFGSMLSQIRSLAYRLSLEQIDFGDRVAIIGENHPHWAVAYLGIIYRGAVVVPLDPSATVETLASFLKNSETKLAFVSESSLEKFRAVSEKLGYPIRVISLQPAAEGNGAASFGNWTQTPRPADFDATSPPAKPADMAVLIYTSGTTGTPKAVPLTHGNIYAEVDGVQEVMRLTDREVILSLLPLFHAYSQIVNLWLATVIGACVVYISEVNSEEIVRGLKEGGVTAITGVPRLWYLFHKKIFDGVRAQPRTVRWLFRSLLSFNGWLRDSLGTNAGRLFFRKVHKGFGGRLRLAVSAGSSFDASVARDYHRLGFTILQGYGLTETSGAATVTRFEDNKVGSVGKPLNHVQVKIDGPNHEGIGEVLIRGDIVMSGYYRNPEANREAFTTDGWFRSGDLGHFDAQGHLYIVGRKKDVIILPSGKNVYPEDVEAHYARSPLVGEICVLGVPDEAHDFAQAEKLCCVIVPDFEYLKLQGIANAREALRFALDNLGRDLPEYQRVRDYVVRSEALPRTATRKVRRFELLKQIESLGLAGGQRRATDELIFSSDDRRLMDSAAGRALRVAIQHHTVATTPEIHPKMNLELDLGLDSLARAECISSVEEALGIEMDSTALATALTVGDVIGLVNGNNSHAASKPQISAERIAKRTDWSHILNRANEDGSEIEQILKRRPLAALVAYLLLRPVYFGSRLFLRMEVRGLEHLKNLETPFLICPNHQSFLDPILVCSVYPHGILKNIFHVGASEYWRNFFTAQIARLLNIVPVDPDTNLMKAMRAGAAGLQAGKILNIYPEGERSFDGLLHPFKKGAAILASELDLPIVPVALDGVYKVWPRKSRRIRLARVKIHFGEPIMPDELARTSVQDDGYRKLTDLLTSRIQAMLDEMRRH